MKVRLSQKGWVVIPAALRQKYGLRPGDYVQVVDYGGMLALVPLPADPIGDGAGMLGSTDSLTQAVINEHCRERERDEARLRP